MKVNTMRTKEDAFTELYNTYHAKILAYLDRKVNSHADAEELAQEVFVRCYRNLDRYDEGKSSMSTWLYVIARNIWKNYLRNGGRTVPLEEGADQFLDQLVVEPALDRAVQLEEERAMLEKGLMSLSEEERELVILKFYYGLKSREIGEKMGMPDANVRVKTQRTMKKLRKFFEKNGMTWEAEGGW